jgi:hypothetical protein
MGICEPGYDIVSCGSLTQVHAEAAIHYVEHCTGTSRAADLAARGEGWRDDRAEMLRLLQSLRRAVSTVTSP